MIMVNSSAKGGTTLRKGWYKRPQPWYISDAIIRDERSESFFQLISDLYEKSSIILTSNKGPDSWGKMLGDQGIATAILDRLLHRCEVIHMDGESHRMKHRETIFE